MQYNANIRSFVLRRSYQISQAQKPIVSTTLASSRQLAKITQFYQKKVCEYYIIIVYIIKFYIA